MMVVVARPVICWTRAMLSPAAAASRTASSRLLACARSSLSAAALPGSGERPMQRSLLPGGEFASGSPWRCKGGSFQTPGCDTVVARLAAPSLATPGLASAGSDRLLGTPERRWSAASAVTGGRPTPERGLLFNGAGRVQPPAGGTGQFGQPQRWRPFSPHTTNREHLNEFSLRRGPRHVPLYGTTSPLWSDAGRSPAPSCRRDRRSAGAPRPCGASRLHAAAITGQ